MNVHATTIKEAQEKADELEAEKKKTEEEKAALTQQLNAILADMQKTEAKLREKEAEIDAIEAELVQAKIDENNQYEDMKKRIRFMYENGNVQLIELLFDSENITEFLNKADYVSSISGYDREMLEEFQAIVKQIEEQEAILKAEYEELSAIQAELASQQAQVQSLLNKAKAKLDDLDEQIGENAKELERLLEEARIAEEKRKAAEAAAANKDKGNGGGSTTVTPGPSVVTGSGDFTHPCPSGYITSYFGEYRSPSDPSHKGMDFGTNRKAAPTYAAADGTVVIAGWSNSAGNWVVINHGNGIVTKYMHHSALCVSAGQRVTKGQQIGMTGTTGWSSGIHLHYQVEVNGVPVNPMNYL
jgi:murein DD-endopeptidase MepM/ murein hydrolase activator NlpD